MTDEIGRREALKRIGAAGMSIHASTAALSSAGSPAAPIVVAGQPAEIRVATLSASTVRITILPLGEENARVPFTGALANENAGELRIRATDASQLTRVRAGDLVVRYAATPPTIHVERQGKTVQRLAFDADAPGMSFLLGRGPVLGWAKAGRSSIARGSTDAMINGQGGYRLATHGTRAPIQWLVGTERLGDVHPPAVRCVRFHGPSSAKFTPRRRRRFRSTLFVVALEGSGGHHARVRAHHRTSRDAAASGRSAISSRIGRSTVPTRSSASPARCARRSCRATRSSISAPSSRRRDGTRATASSPGIPTNFPEPEADARRAARRALQGRDAHRDRGAASHGIGRRSVHRAAAAERPDAGRQVAARPPGVVLLADS